MTLSIAFQEAITLKVICEEIIHESQENIVIFCEKGAIDLSKSGGYRPITKHIADRHNFLRDEQSKREIYVRVVST